jgi:peptide/nickel transport system substrate-binding protein
MPQHLLDTVPRSQLLGSTFAKHPVGSGRYRFDAWDRKRRLTLVADSANYRGRPRFDRVIWTVAPDPNTATMAVLAGQADVLEVLRGDAVARAARVSTLRAVEYGSLDYGYLVFNQRPARGRTVLFADRALRVALSAAVDRAAVVQNALDSLGRVALGPVTRAEPTADSTLRQIAFDTAAAARALDALGWRWEEARGVRLRGGRPLAFSILVPASSATRGKLAVLLQAQYARIGAKVEVEAVEPGVFASRLRDGDFDAALNLWRNDPSPSTLRQAWGTPHGEDVGANFGRYANAAFDATVDSATATFDPVRRTVLFRRAYQIILDDAPALWLYEPRNLAAVHSRLIPVDVRADAWLAGLGDWQVQGLENARPAAVTGAH